MLGALSCSQCAVRCVLGFEWLFLLSSTNEMNKPTLLLLGGTRFLGLNFLARFGHAFDTTVISRRQPEICDWESQSHGQSKCQWIQADRYSALEMTFATKDKFWDVVVDCLCYSADHAKVFLDALSGRYGHLIMISSRAVYCGGGPFSEMAFRPEHHQFQLGLELAPFGSKAKSGQIDYGEGKRQAEAYFAQEAPGSSTFLRLPIIVGKGDYTNRLDDLVAGIRAGKRFDFGSEGASTSFVSVDAAADAVFKLSSSEPQGGLNVASPSVKIAELIHLLQELIGVSVLRGVGEGSVLSPFRALEEAGLDCEKASSMGIKCPSIVPTLESLILPGSSK
jgi:nucleoside-diphosphate-sugar epimerase